MSSDPIKPLAIFMTGFLCGALALGGVVLALAFGPVRLASNLPGGSADPAPQAITIRQPDGTVINAPSSSHVRIQAAGDEGAIDTSQSASAVGEGFILPGATDIKHESKMPSVRLEGISKASSMIDAELGSGVQMILWLVGALVTGAGVVMLFSKLLRAFAWPVIGGGACVLAVAAIQPYAGPAMLALMVAAVVGLLIVLLVPGVRRSLLQMRTIGVVTKAVEEQSDPAAVAAVKPHTEWKPGDHIKARVKDLMRRNPAAASMDKIINPAKGA
jgi:hypothetical protein